MSKPFRFLAIALYAAVLCVTGGGLASWAADHPYPLPDFIKGQTYPLEDTSSSEIPPNVLFLIDTGSPMVMTPTGTLPTVAGMPNVQDRIDALAESTYGTGARPYGENIGNGQYNIDDNEDNSRFGRDIVTSNNRINDPDCYYTPDPNRPYLLTFRDKNWANWNGNGSLPNPSTGSGITPAQRNSIEAYISSGNAITEPELVALLVPNDSRMYQMKLVLWRLLSEENSTLLSKMRVAMALSYQEDSYGAAMWADFYKFSPFGNTEKLGNVTFSNGSGPNWSTGLTATSSGAIAPGYLHAATANAGVNRDYYDYGSTSLQWRTVNRAVLKLPFNFLYVPKSEGGLEATSNLTTFRQYINGIEVGNSTSVSDPELIADGQTPLSTAIHGRDYHVSGYNSEYPNAGDTANVMYSNKAIYFETRAGAQKQNYSSSYIRFQDFTIPDGRGGNIKAGLAVGSVVDFFSPRTKELPSDKVRSSGMWGDLPVIGSCQNNWLVVLTAGNDSDPNAHTAAEAVKKLYEQTKEIRGRAWNDTTQSWVEQTFTMDHGVRTLVVGFVDETNPATEDLRQTLTDMANWGDPSVDARGNVTANPNSKPYFANNVPQLLDKLQDVLLRINNMPLAASAPRITESEMGPVLYQSSYVPKAYDQWEGTFIKYDLDHDAATLAEKWELNDHIVNPPNRVTDRTDRVYVGYAPGQGQSNSSTSIRLLDSINNNNFEAYAGVPSAYAARFKDWLLNYGSGNIARGESLLGDMEHGGFAVVGAPADYATGIDKGRAKRVYLHTNRGFLHSVDDETGIEKWAFMPPNVFQTHKGLDTRTSRMVPLKFDKKKLREGADAWLSGDGLTSDTTNSKALDLLDGNLVAKELINGGNYRTVLIGCLGYGGNGLYALDVTNPTDDVKVVSGTNRNGFLWALENVRYGKRDVEGNSGQKVDAPGDISDSNNGDETDGVELWLTSNGNKDDYGYRDLGLTINPPALLTTSRNGDVGLLPGGLGYNLGADRQGKALFVIKPFTGEIIEKLDEADFTAPGSRKLGMLLGPVIYANDVNRTAKVFFTADSQGNVLYGDILDKPASEWKLKSVFQLLASDSRKTPISVPVSLLYATGGTQKDEWIFGGTADIMVTDEGAERKMENPEQYIWGHNLTKTGVLNEDLNVNITRANLGEAQYGESIVSGDIHVVKTNGANDQDGWFLKLRPASSAEGIGAEYVTTPPYIYGGKLYISTFTPKTTPGDLLCVDTGDSYLYTLDPSSGGGSLRVMENVKISGMSAYKGSFYVAAKPFRVGAVSDLEANNPDIKALAVNLLRIDVESQDSSDLPAQPNVPHIKYWKEH